MVNPRTKAMLDAIHDGRDRTGEELGELFEAYGRTLLD